MLRLWCNIFLQALNLRLQEQILNTHLLRCHLISLCSDLVFAFFFLINKYWRFQIFLHRTGSAYISAAGIILVTYQLRISPNRDFLFVLNFDQAFSSDNFGFPCIIFFLSDVFKCSKTKVSQVNVKRYQMAKKAKSC